MKSEDYIFITLESYRDDESHTLKQHIFKPIDKEDFYADRKWIGNKSLCVSVGDEDEKNADFDSLLDRNENLNSKTICKSCIKIYLKNRWKKLENSGLDNPLLSWNNKNPDKEYPDKEIKKEIAYNKLLKESTNIINNEIIKKLNGLPNDLV